MGEFQKVAEELIQISQKVIHLIKSKSEYAKTINYQITQLFQQLGESTSQEGALLMETDHLHKRFSESQLNILFCRDNRQSSYITPEDLCTFLHISKHNLRRNSTVSTIDQSLLEQFYSFLDAEEQLEEEAMNALSEINLESWFAEVDFFNNGYIDTSALYEYFIHYDTNQHVFEEYNALIILKIIKRHSLSDKLVLEDFKNFIDKSAEIQIFLTSEQLSPADSQKAEPKILDKHYKHKSNELYSLSSEISITPEIKIGPKLIDHNYNNNHFETLSMISREQIEEDLRQEENTTYEERLIRLHARNEKYIREAKRQMESIIPICNAQIHTHMQVQAFKTNSAQLIREIRLLGDIYNKIIRTIQTFLSRNSKFTFLNAFSLLDVSETNSVSLARWKDFAKELEITLPIKKLTVFFNYYSRNGVLSFSNFLKIFKYAGLEDDYVRCSARYPFIYENWSDELLENYKQFLIKMVRLIEQRQIIVENVQKEQQELEILLKSFTYLEEIIEILGEEYRLFVREYFQQCNSRLDCRLLALRTTLS